MFDPRVAKRLLEQSHQYDAVLNRQSLCMSMPFLRTTGTLVDEARMGELYAAIRAILNLLPDVTHSRYP